MARTLAGVGIVAATLFARANAAADDEKCLDNSGVFAVDAGVTYSDTNGDWMCQPDAPGATVGGWVLVPPSPTAVVEPIASMNDPGAPPAPDDGSSTHLLFWVASLVGAVGTAVVALFVLLRRNADSPLAGTLSVKEVRGG
jgi:hypothetical protein